MRRGTLLLAALTAVEARERSSGFVKVVKRVAQATAPSCYLLNGSPCPPYYGNPPLLDDTTATTTTDESGATVISQSGQAVTIPPGATGPITTTVNDVVFTFSPPSTTTDDQGQTIISQSGQAVTIPPGATGPITTTINDVVFTFSPPSTRTDDQGQTIISQSGQVATIPPGVINPVTTTVNGVIFTYSPPALPEETPSTTTDSQGQTILSLPSDGAAITIPPGITTPVVTSFPNGQIITFTPSPSNEPSPTPTPSPGSEVSPEDGEDDDDDDTPIAILPVTTPVGAPQASDDGSIIPCNLWFFSTCIGWDDLNIFGWMITLPPGDYPPGPPPGFSDGPIAISVSGTLPPWPPFSIGPDRVLTFPPSPEPTACETQTAELCATRTSFGVSVSETVTVTTTSQVLSACATVLGCNAQDGSETSTITGGCTSATTVTNVFVSCPASNTDLASCSTTSTAESTGCSVTATTETCKIASPTGLVDDPACDEEGTEYIVYPKDGKNSDQVARIEAKLREFAGVELFASTSQTLGLNYWRVLLTDDQRAEIEVLTDVASVSTQCADGCYDPTTAIVYENDVLPQLEYISWPPGREPNAPRGHRYYHDESSGSGINVYIVDTGATMSHPEFDNLRNRVRWIQVGTGSEAAEDDCPTQAKRHGTAMLSLVAGKSTGVAKNINPIVVRMPCRPEAFTPEDFIDGLSKVNDELEGNVPAVILLASYWPYDKLSFGFFFRCRDLLTAMESKGAIAVTGCGNGNLDSIDGYPASLGKRNVEPLERVESLLVIGSVSPDGRVRAGNHDDAAGLPHAYAPGLMVKAADGNEENWGFDPLKGSSGTSDAAAMTAGLAAYLMRLSQLGDLDGVGTSPQDINAYILMTAWSRFDVDGAPRPGVWNTADIEQRMCEWNPNPITIQSRIRRRQDSCAIPLEPGSDEAPESEPGSASPTPESTPEPTLEPTPIPSETTDTASEPTITDAPVYCIPFQDPGRGIHGYCQCENENSDWAYYSFAEGDNPCPYTSPGPAESTIDPATVVGTGGFAEPSPTPTPTPEPEPEESPYDGPVIGNPCNPDNDSFDCTEDATEIIYCYCGDGDCNWTSFGKCQGGSATCHHGNNCGMFFSVCC